MGLDHADSSVQPQDSQQNRQPNMQEMQAYPTGTIQYSQPISGQPLNVNGQTYPPIMAPAYQQNLPPYMQQNGNMQQPQFQQHQTQPQYGQAQQNDFAYSLDIPQSIVDVESQNQGQKVNQVAAIPLDKSYRSHVKDNKPAVIIVLLIVIIIVLVVALSQGTSEAERYAELEAFYTTQTTALNKQRYEMDEIMKYKQETNRKNADDMAAKQKEIQAQIAINNAKIADDKKNQATADQLAKDNEEKAKLKKEMEAIQTIILQLKKQEQERKIKNQQMIEENERRDKEMQEAAKQKIREEAEKQKQKDQQQKVSNQVSKQTKYKVGPSSVNYLEFVGRNEIRAYESRGYYVATLEIVQKYKSEISYDLGTWAIIGFIGGKIDGSGYGNVISKTSKDDIYYYIERAPELGNVIMYKS